MSPQLQDFIRAWEWAAQHRRRHLTVAVARWMAARLADYEEER